MSQGLDSFGCINNTIKVSAGHYVDLANPEPSTIEIKSIAAALSKICRFGGHCPKFYSVAEHCFHACLLAIDEGVRLDALKAVLLHDAAEAYIGDMVKPLKLTIPEYCVAEQRIEQAIQTAFGIDFRAWAEVIKRFDRAMLKIEKTQMWPEDQEHWAGFSEIDVPKYRLGFWEPTMAEERFLWFASQLGLRN